MPPFFSVVTVTYNDVWGLSKTIASLASQSFSDFEYIVVDGGSTDGTHCLIDFWQGRSLITRFDSEPDNGVYDGMNKAVARATGKYVCFMNAGDVFSRASVLEEVHDCLCVDEYDGLIGWGELNGQTWASWHLQTDAVRLASLGFCHQSLYLGRKWLERFPFDDREGRTDSDTKQFAACLQHGALIRRVDTHLSRRSPSPGISANLERTALSIGKTLEESYDELDGSAADKVIGFRRTCANPEQMVALLGAATGNLQQHLAIMILDTLFLRQAKNLDTAMSRMLMITAAKALKTTNTEGIVTGNGINCLWDLRQVMSMKLLWAEQQQANRSLQISQISEQQKVLDALKPQVQETADFVVSFTTFPQRLQGLELMLHSIVNQKVRPREIWMNLGRDEFPSERSLPQDVLKFREDGLRIQFVDQTRHQYDKFIGQLDQLGETALVIVDDDVVYSPMALAHLVSTAAEFPDCVIANRSHMMAFDEYGSPVPYTSWFKEVDIPQPSHRLFPTGAGGVFYPKGFFANLPEIDSVLTCCPYADDVWLKMASIYRDVPVKSTQAIARKEWKLDYTPSMGNAALHEFNVDLGLNDLQLSKAWSWLSEAGIDIAQRMEQ